MNIAIATFHNAVNYGAVLQAFALQTFLRKKGHSSFFINHHFSQPPIGLRKYFSKTPNTTIAKWVAIRRRTVFIEFVRQHLTVAHDSYYNPESFSEMDSAADAYICGSDQIWNPNYLRNEKDEKLFFLNFGPKSTRRIAYAASIGSDTLSPCCLSRFVEHLQYFDFISVREKKSALLLNREVKKDVTWVPDPTLLLSPDTYRESLGLDSGERNVIFSYTLDKEISELTMRVRKVICDIFSMPLIETYERNPFRILAHGVYDPCQWLSVLATSSFVVTNSFHGTVFAILFKRPFIVLPIEGKSSGMNSRIESLLEKVGLSERLLTVSDEHQIRQLSQSSIDWDEVDKRVRNFANVGSLFLEKALAK